VTRGFGIENKIISWGTPAEISSSIPPEIPLEKKSNYFQEIPRIIFISSRSFYICIVNQLNKNKMKTANVIGMVWTGVLMVTLAVALGFTVYQLLTGNYHGTASFEF
jgi:hypothetical protein